MTNLPDALSAYRYGADAVGFIFYSKSPRYIRPETAMNIIKNLPREICKVGVFVNHDACEIKDIFHFCGLSLIQLHGDESFEYCTQFPASMLIKAIPLGTQSDLHALHSYPVRAILVDSRRQGQYGGTGETSNWDLASRAKEIHPLILAGGLNEENIQEAINTVSPHAVDLNTGVEDAPGRKNLEKIKNIIRLIRKIEKSQPKEMTGRDARIFIH